MTEIIIDTDKSKLNTTFINDFISNSYWGKGRTLEQTQKIIENSLNFGVYLGNRQIGYARVVTDFTIFAYILDVFIVKNERRKGYSKKLMNHILTHPELKNIENWKLATLDAHGLYEKYGFNKIANPEKMMERKLNNQE